MLSSRMLQAELLLKGDRIGRCEIDLETSSSRANRRSIDSFE